MEQLLPREAGRQRYASAFDSVDYPACWGVSGLALQSQLGVLPERRRRLGGLDPGNSAIDGPNIGSGGRGRGKGGRFFLTPGTI